MNVNQELDAVLDALALRTRTVMSTSAERAANAIREQVAEGLLRCGTRLPEERLAAALSVSRNTLREALSQLVSERLLVREPHRGVVVARPNADDITDLYRVRRVIEPAAIRLAHADDPRRAALSDAVAEGRAAHAREDWIAVASANHHFHRAVVALADSPRLDTQMALVMAETRLVFQLLDSPAAFHTPYIEQNDAVTALLLAGDLDAAAQAMQRYLDRSRDDLLSRIAR